MTREEFLSKLIKKQGHTIQGFAKQIGLPTSTLRSILKNVGGASADNVFKICGGLSIKADDLNTVSEVESTAESGPDPDISADKLKTQKKPSKKDTEYIHKYLRLTETSKDVVNCVIDYAEKAEQQSTQTTTIFRAAKSTDNHPPEVIETDKDFSKIPPTKIKL